MKHHIVITCGRSVVENMMSKIATPKELRARLAKKYPGKYQLYFRTIDPQYGWFSNGYGVYFWFIDSNPEKRQKKPESIPEKRLIRSRPNPILNICTQNPYGLYEGDVFSLPKLEDSVCVRQQVRKDTPVYINFVKASLNNRISWISLNDIQRLEYEKFENQYEALKFFAGKTVRITSAVLLGKTPNVVDRGLLTGKPLMWRLRPIEVRQKEFKYEIL